MGWPVFEGVPEPGECKDGEARHAATQVVWTGSKLPPNLHFRLGTNLWRYKRVKGDGRCFYRSLAASVATETRTGTEIRRWLACATVEDSVTHVQVVALWQKKLAQSSLCCTVEAAKEGVHEYNAKVTSYECSVATWGDSDDALVYTLLTGVGVVCLGNSPRGLVVLFDSKAVLETIAAVPTTATLTLPAWKDESAHIYFHPFGDPFVVPGNGRNCNHYDALVKVQGGPPKTHWIFEGGSTLIKIHPSILNAGRDIAGTLGDTTKHNGPEEDGSEIEGGARASAKVCPFERTGHHGISGCGTGSGRTRIFGSGSKTEGTGCRCERR